MRMVNVHDAKTNFSRLVDAASGGEVIVIARSGRPVAKLARLDAPAGRSPRLGFLAFSVASIWEVAIKAGLNRPEFRCYKTCPKPR